MKTGIHSARLLLRRPYKLLLCSLVNLVVILFTVIEGVQMTETRAAMKAAMESRFYTGTVTRLIEVESDSGVYTYTDSSPIDEDVIRVLEASPYVDSVHSCVTRTAHFGDGKKYVTGDAAQLCMFVGVSCGEIMISGQGDYVRQRFLIRPTYLAAGDPDTFYIGYDELHPFPTVVFSHFDENLETHRDERYFLYAETSHTPKQTANAAYVYNPPEDIAMYYPQYTLMVGEKPGDEVLSDEEFAAKVMREYGLEETAKRLEDLQDMTAVVKIPTLDMFLPWRNNLMRLVSGRALTEADVGKKVCMFPSAMLASMRKKVGDTVFLANAKNSFMIEM